jgi:solute carrier family 25 (peroxisomal adenine nucleotide transporter), member 17
MRKVIIDAYEGKRFTTSGRRKSSDPEMADVGFHGLYQGLEMQIVKGFLSQGVTFLVKGR